MPDDDAPKSAYEIALARLRRKDEEAGVAEREILHQAALRKMDDPEARAALEEEYQRDRERLASERDRKLDQVRQND